MLIVSRKIKPVVDSPLEEELTIDPKERMIRHARFGVPGGAMTEWDMQFQRGKERGVELTGWKWTFMQGKNVRFGRAATDVVLKTGEDADPITPADFESSSRLGR